MMRWERDLFRWCRTIARNLDGVTEGHDTRRHWKLVHRAQKKRAGLPASAGSGLQRLIQVRQYVLDGLPIPHRQRIISGLTPALACSLVAQLAMGGGGGVAGQGPWHPRC